MDGPIFQWESNNDGQPNLWFGFSNKFNAYLGPPEYIEDVGTGSHRILTMQFFQKANKIVLRISALASKKRLNQKKYDTLIFYCYLKII